MRFNKIFLFVCFSALFVANAIAQLPPIFDQTPREILAGNTIAEFPVNTFLENVAVNKKGDLFVNSYEEGKIYRVTTDGAKTEFAKINGKIAGIALDKKENLIVSGWENGTKPSVFIVSKNGKIESATPLDGGMFPNGVTFLGGDIFLIADSYKGAIWSFDAKTKKTAVWLADEKLARSSASATFPAVNGLKIFRNTLYATNTEKQLFLKIPLLAGNRAGKPEIWREKINGDDFAFAPNGDLYVATHVYNSVVKIAPDGKTTIVAENGAVVGDTSLAFGRSKTDKNVIYVVTNGGVSLPPKEGVQTAKIVKIETGK